jgi:predicted AlkP superfamily pyrophosphatase or phosphodiesterase
MRRIGIRLPVAMALIIATTSHVAAQDGSQVRLILQITVDGMRGDLLSRYGDRFGADGFRYLISTGTYFANAHYQHANTETIVGHTTLSTGTFPSRHGMVGNVWFDRDTGELSYNIEDPDYPLLPSREESLEGAQLDPAQQASRTAGRSPVSILASTFSDELAVHYAGRSKIFSVAGKDRSAVAMAGHAGKAFWLSTNTGDYVTSSFYYDAYPEWAAQWNAKRIAESHSGGNWSLLNEPSTYLLSQFDDRPYETDLKGYGRTFPHPFSTPDNPLFYTLLLVSPIGDRLNAGFAKALIENEGLGRDEVPDYLAVGFSSVDAVNHFFGPSSLENEDVVLQLDRVLADLLAYVDEKVGLNHTLIVLAADHGMPEMPEFMNENGLAVGRIHSEDIIEFANDATLRRYGVADVAKIFFRPYLYLNAEVIKAAELDHAEVAKFLAEELSLKPGIATAVASSALPSMQDTPLLRQIRNNHHLARSGDIYLVQEPYWFLYDKGPIAVMHGSPWRYDTYVPIVFSGPGIPAQTIHRSAHPADVAPTLAAFIGIKPPSSATGEPLHEVIR